MLKIRKRIFGSYKKIWKHYASHVELSENEFNAEKIMHESACNSLSVIRKMLDQEYNVIDVSQSKGIDDSNFKEILDITKNIRIEVFQLMCGQRENLISNFSGFIDEEISGYIKNHDELFYCVGKCIFPMEVYYQRKTKLREDLIDLLNNQKRG